MPTQAPFVLTLHPKLEEGRLALVPCNLALTAIDGAGEEIFLQLDDQEALWDTGADISVITEDLLSNQFLEYLQDDVHKEYRGPRGTQVACSIKLGFSNRAIDMHMIMLVTKRENIPNHRSGIILGQHAFLDRLSYTSSPAAVLNAKGEHIPDNLWGRIDVVDYVTLDGDLAKTD